ncbi:M56 family metallopeptidase [Anaerophilus nitritogenes]|uniref:M56 family metallopeptidase n=1 Tax=Anaerophilus nitritogenes TaxID=2498136 RepID=UPI00101D316B|nr:M56 family metallopeptidase [Anaerophilus nitritogenes]
MENIFNSLLIASFYATVVGVITILIKVVLKNRLSPQWHYIIWIVLILKLLVPFGPKSTVSLFNIIPQFSQQSQQHILDQHNPIIQRSNSILPIENSLESKKNIKAETKVIKTVVNWKELVSYGWFIGAVFMMLWMIFAYCSLYKKLCKSTYIADRRLLNLLKDCKVQMMVRRNIPLLVQDVVSIPSLVGMINPKILLTHQVAKLSDKEIRYILLHELAHYKTKDIMMSFLLVTLQIIHWFNPVIWYCFRQIRRDMEVATDAKVLSNLEMTEHKEYGRTILTILEFCSKPKFDPILIGMADDRKSIERRLRMITRSGFFKSKKNVTIIIGMICLVVLGGTFLTNGISDRNEYYSIDRSLSSVYKQEDLLKYRSRYMGDASNISNLLDRLPFGDLKEGISLATTSKPYGITINYNLSNINIGREKVEETLYSNALIMFVLIENVDHIIFKDTNTTEQFRYQFLRNIIQKNFKNDLWQYSKDIKTFQSFLNTLDDSSDERHKDIETAVSYAIRERGQFYNDGEYTTEGHIILGTEEIKNKVKVYALASVGTFAFENGIFTKIGGTAEIPTVMIFSINKNGEYDLVEYKEPMDGTDYIVSIKKMFPKKYHNKVFSGEDEYLEISKQEEAQASKYLKSIGREAQVRVSHVEKKLANINVEASNKLFAEFTKEDIFLNNCPYWIGTRERVEDGVRYVYETLQTKTSDGYDVITFRKIKEEGTIVEERNYKIDGNTPKLIDEKS